MVAQQNIGKFGGKPRQSCPCLHERVGFCIEPIKVIGDPKRIKMLQRGWQNIAFLKHHDWLVVAPTVTNDGGQPPKFQITLKSHDTC